MNITINTKQEDLVIVFHHNDQDGALSAALLKQYYQNQSSTFYSYMVDYSKEYDLTYFIHTINECIKQNSNCTKPVVYFVDYTCPDIDKLYVNCQDNNVKMVWIDHHISNIQKYKDLSCDGIRSIEHSGCYLTWEYLYPNNKQIPLLVNCIDHFDRHDLQCDVPFTDIVAMVYYFDSFDLHLDDDVNGVYLQYLQCLENSKNLDIIIKQGKIILKYNIQQSKNNTKEIQCCKLNEQIDCLVLNTWQHGSWLFDNVKMKEDKDYLMVLWYLNGQNQYKYSFYSGENSSIDCSKIAASLGGGGHKHAAGCQLDYFLFN